MKLKRMPIYYRKLKTVYRKPLNYYETQRYIKSDIIDVTRFGG